MGNVEYPFIAITPKSTQTRSGCFRFDLNYGLEKSVWKLLVLDRNTIKMQIICIKNNFLEL